MNCDVRRVVRRQGFVLLSFATLLVGLSGCSQSPAQRYAGHLEKGKASRARNDYDRAVIEFKNAAQAMPKDAEPYYQLGLTYLAKNDPRSAFGMLTKATELNPKHAGAQLQLATFQMISSLQDKTMLDKAQSRIQSVLDASPDNASALQLRAITEFNLGRLSEASQDLQHALDKSPQHLASAISLANLKLMQKDVLGGEAVLKQAMLAAPRSAEAALALANYYLQTDRRPDAELQIKHAIQLDPKNASALMLLANFQVKAGQNEQAEQTYRQISALSDSSLKPLHAIFVFQHGKRSDAISELAGLLRQSPNDRNLRSLLVSAYVESGNPQGAQAILNESLKRNPKDVDALLQRSVFFMSTGKLNETEADLRSVLQSKPDSAEAHYGLAKIYAVRRTTLLQRQELSEALRLNPKLLDARIELSDLLRISDPKAALWLLDQSPEQQRNIPAYIVARNWALLGLKNYAAVEKNIETGLAIARVPALLYQDAVLKYTLKQYAAARPILEEVLKQNPENLPALNLLAESYTAQGNMLKALEAVEDYASRKPKSPSLLSLVGVWRANARQLGTARQAFLDAISVNPDYLPAHLALADLEVSTGDLAGARRTLQGVRSRQPGDLQARMRLADIEQKLGNASAAVEHYRAVVLAEPNNTVALNNLAYILATDKPDEAVTYAEKAVELAPGSVAAQDTLGWVYYRKGNYQRSLAYFKAVVAKEPTAVRKYHLALAYAKTGDQQLSQENLNAALRLDPKLDMPEPLMR